MEQTIFSEQDLCDEESIMMGDFEDHSPSFLSSSQQQQVSESDDSESDRLHDEKSSKNGKKRKGYSKEITKVLNDWFFANLQNPYPSEEEKKEMVNQTTLTLLQINNWFSNKRVRYKRKMQKEGQEVIDGGIVIDINQAFRSIKKQNKGEKNSSNAVSSIDSTSSSQSSAAPKRKRSSASKDASCSKKKRPTPLSVVNHVKTRNGTTSENDSTPTSAITTLTPPPSISTTTTTTLTTPSSSLVHNSSSPAVTSSSEPKNVLSSLLEAPSNKNLNGSSVVLLRSPILTNQSPGMSSPQSSCPQSSPKMTPDERSPCSTDEAVCSQQPKKIDFFQSLQQAGVIFPQTPAIIPVIPSYPPYAFVHHHAAAYYPVSEVVANSSPTSSPYQYSYPIYSTTAIPATFYATPHSSSTSTFMIPKEEEVDEIGLEQHDAASCFELEDNCLDDVAGMTSNNHHENYSCQDNTFNTTDLFESTATENENCLFLDSGRDVSSGSWMNSTEDCSLLYF
nr:unnamed protein product [Naegleria fowleri]